MSTIDESLRKIAAESKPGNGDVGRRGESKTSLSTDLPGDPNCPICHGLGYLHQDVPVGHPDFGRARRCTCMDGVVRRELQNRLYRQSNLEMFKNLTFASFNVEGRGDLGDDQSKSLQAALELSKQFAQTLRGWLMLMGPYGSGKTHLAAAIANQAVASGTATLFLTVPDLLDWLRFSYGNTDVSFEERFNEIRNIEMLVLDDLGTQNATPWAEEKLFQIINHRYVNHLPMVVTTNLDLAQIDGRVTSRLLDQDLTTAVKINAPDFRLSKDLARSTHIDLGLLENMTLMAFLPRMDLEREQQDNLRTAHQLAADFAEHPRGWLVFSGKHYTGKTHLAAAIGNYRQLMGTQVSFWQASELLDHLRSTFNPDSTITYDKLFESVKTSPLLILDDYSVQGTTPWAQEKLYQILNYRYMAGLPTVITTAVLKPEDLDERMRYRMTDRRRVVWFTITAPPFKSGPNEPGPVRARSKRTTR